MPPWGSTRANAKGNIRGNTEPGKHTRGNTVGILCSNVSFKSKFALLSFLSLHVVIFFTVSNRYGHKNGF